MSPVALFSAMQQHTQSALGMAVHGSQPAPGLPCALVHEGEATMQSSGEKRREDAKVCLQRKMRNEGAMPSQRHCERSEAIQSLSAEGFWIASLRSQ
ncbi:hypothetical protein QRQ56_00570 [Bradyrhizobium sp. U531]|uniref:hypothetical protein n=1 Tax=Bradyrhizobium sp. U531 TaxID=3053458 RepID=UPI003F43D7C4